MKEGSIKCYITKAVVQGEARVGKTSLKCALTKENYVKTSTSVIEPSVAVRCYSRDSKSGQYKLISVEEMRAKVRNAMQSKAKDKAATDEAATGEAATDETAADKATTGKVATDKGATDKAATDKIATNKVAKNKIATAKGATAKAAVDKVATNQFHTSSQPQVLSKSSQKANEATTPASEATTLTNEASSVSVNKTREMQNAIAIVEQFHEDCKKAQEEGKTLDNEHWLYFIDTGGQIQFQKLLPVFMPFASVLIVVVSLAKSLTERSEEVMHYEGEDMMTGSKTLTVEEVLKQLFSSVIPSAFNYMDSLANDRNLSKHITFAQQLRSDASKLKINIIPVATCGDKDTEVKGIKEIKEKLYDMLKCHENKCELYRPSKGGATIHILEVDGRIADPEKEVPEDRTLTTKKSLEIIAEELEKNEYKITVPLKWYCFDVLLHEVASKDCGILTLSFCKELGKKLGMSLPEIKNALIFLHLFNRILYYHNSEACNDLVFVEINSLVNILKELVMSIYKGHAEPVHHEWVPLVRKGKLTIETMVKVCKDVLNSKEDSNGAPDFQHLRSQYKNPQFEVKLLKLFQELLIAAELSHNEYFIPALLPLKDVTHVPPNADSSPPLLFRFEDAVPMGHFCAVIVHLLSHPHVKWELRDSETNYSNYFALEWAKDSTVKIILVEQINYIELHCDDKEYQGIAREFVEEAIISATEKHNLSINYKKGFYCLCDDAKDGKHFAIFSRLKEKYVIECKKQNDSWMHWLTCKF